jgi:hypothetical protein
LSGATDQTLGRTSISFRCRTLGRSSSTRWVDAMFPVDAPARLCGNGFGRAGCAVGHVDVRHRENGPRITAPTHLKSPKGSGVVLDQKSLPHRRSMGQLSFSSPLRTSPGANSGQIRRSRGHHFKLQPQSCRQHVSGRRKDELDHQPALHAKRMAARYNPVWRVAHSGRARTSKRPATSPAGSGVGGCACRSHGRPRWRSPQLCRHCQARQRP